jgi:hypothetical protein
MANAFQRTCRWLWLPASAVAVTGIVGLADLAEVSWRGKLLFVGPHVAAAGLAVWPGQRLPWAAVVALCGLGTMAALSWWDRLDRQSEGFEWQFNNAFGGALCCIANYLVLAAVVCVVSLIGAYNEHADADAVRRD